MIREKGEGGRLRRTEFRSKEHKKKCRDVVRLW
jgi:hypothetical protein